MYISQTTFRSLQTLCWESWINALVGLSADIFLFKQFATILGYCPDWYQWDIILFKQFGRWVAKLEMGG
jgi:hypothetical protein